MTASLTEKQLLFVDEYLIDLNATKAAERAGYSEKTAYSQGQRLLKHVEVAALIEARSLDRQKRTEITQDRVVQAIAEVAFGNFRELFTDTGHLRPISDWPDDAVSLVAGLEVVRRRVPGGEDDEYEDVAKVKLNDRLKALDMLMRHLGAYNDGIDVNVRHSVGQRLLEARGRLGNVIEGQVVGGE